MRRLLFIIVGSLIGMSVSAQNGTRTRSVYAPSTCADVALPRRADSLDKLVIARMREDRIPAVQLSVLRNGRVETRVYGYADLDHCVPADSNTIFGLGSVSKQLTAYATLRLVQAGSIALDEPVTKYLPEARPMWDGITIRHLLTHTSGIRDYGRDDRVYPQQTIERRIDYSADSLIHIFARAPLNFPAGTAFAYSNTGYYMLSIALERAAHMPFADLMRTLVYRPLGMRSAGGWNPQIILPNLAVGYGTYDDTLTHAFYRAPTAGRWGGDTGLQATAADVARFQAELIHPRLLSAAMVGEMTARDTLSSGSTVTYGYGIQPTDVRGVPMWMHAGSFSAGYTAFVATFPTRDFSVTVATNSHTAAPWLLVMQALPLLDHSLRPLPAMQQTDPQVTRTAQLRALVSGDSTALPMTPGFRSFAYGALKARFRGMSAALTFLDCDDLRHSKAALPDLATSECYYHLGSDRADLTLGVYFTDMGAVADVRTKG
jgi:CubicO group peptidase (beta-lactamase class C family)